MKPVTIYHNPKCSKSRAALALLPIHQTTAGILAMLAAVAVFAVMDAAIKQLAAAYPPMQIGCLRGLTAIPPLLAMVALTGKWRSLLPTRWGEHLLRGLLAIIMLWMFIYAVRELSLGAAYSIFLCAPLLITVLSALVLRERVGGHRWLAIVCGLGGVVVILNPSQESLITLAGLAAFVSAFCYAIAALMIRRLARTDSTLSIAFSFVFIIAIAAGIVAWPNWVPISPEHWPWIAALGLSGAAGQYLIIQAFRYASPSVVAPFEYTAILWGVALDWLLWNTIPDARILTGAGLIIASGLYVIYREHWLARRLAVPAPPH